MGLPALLQFLHCKAVHRSVFLILFRDEIKKFLLRTGFHQASLERGVLEQRDNATQKLQVIHRRVLRSHDQEENMAWFPVDRIKINPFEGPTEGDEKGLE